MKERQRRLRAIRVFLALALLALVARVVEMQLFHAPVFQEKARQNMVREVPVSGPRGLILDRHGRVLARNTARFTIRLVPGEVSHPTRALERISDVLHLPAEQAQDLEKQIQEMPAEPVVIKESLDDVTLARFAEIQGDFPGIDLEVNPVREYPLGSLAAHVLGYVGEIDEESLRRLRSKGYFHGEWVGKDGVELAHERLLHGSPGTRIIQVDATGQPVRRLEERPPHPGNDLYLTLDARLQRTAEEALARTLEVLKERNGVGSGGVVVAIEAQTGRVRALASLPQYNPNHFARGISSRRFSRLVEDPRAPLMDRAVCGAYPPGSTYKIITTSAALAEGLVTSASVFYCPGYQMVGGMPFNCFVTSGHGALDMVNCLAHSCDVAYYQLGTQLGLERMEKYSRAFGLGARTGIDLPGEVAGNMPHTGWKEENVGEEWFAGDNANMAIGQGFLAVSPVQMAVATAAVANGGRVFKPYLLERIRDSSGASHEVPAQQVRQVPVPPGDLAVVREGMIGAVDRGTAAGVDADGLEMAGKTGTVENSPTPDNPYGRNHTWFTSYAPASNPDLVVTVFLEKSGGYGGSLAAPIAAQVYREWKAIQAAAQPLDVVPVDDWDRSPPPAAANP